jgi:hypothetical protein
VTALNRLGVAVVEVDREELLASGIQQGVCLGELEDERLLDQEWNPSTEQLHCRLEVVFVRKAHGDKGRLLLIKHPIDARVRTRAVFGCALCRALSVPTNYPDQLGIGTGGKEFRVLLRPHTRANNRYSRDHRRTSVLPSTLPLQRCH